MKEKIDAVRVVLPSKRVAILRELKISDNQLAAKLVGNKAKNQFEMALAMQSELIKLLLLQIDDKKLDHADKNNLDILLSVSEYSCLSKVIQKMSGGDESGEDPEMETTFV